MREPDPADRRKVIVRMTPKARRWAARYQATFGQAIDALTDRYSEAEIALIADYFRRSARVIQRQLDAFGKKRRLDRLAAQQPRPLAARVARRLAHEDVLQRRQAVDHAEAVSRRIRSSGLSLENSRFSPSHASAISIVSKRRQRW